MKRGGKKYKTEGLNSEVAGVIAYDAKLPMLK